MNRYTDKVGNKLNALLEKTYDAEKGYKKAAENTDNMVLKTFFNNKSKQRYDFGHQLKAELNSFGQKIEKGGSLTGATHRAWMDIKSVLTSDSGEAMLQEAKRGEKAAVEEYNEVLSDTTLPQSTSAILMQQKNQIEMDLSKEKIMESIK